MKRQELQATLSLGSIFAFRMMGLFMIYPVFALYAQALPHATPTLIGMALGIYGLTQAILQVPFGMLSDKIGRKPIIVTGLVLFAIGSVIAALSHQLPGIIVGRALQGCGAIGSTIMAAVADNTHEDNRIKAMAMIGMIIALSFIAAMGLGPILNTWIGIPGIFGFTAILAMIGIIVLFLFVPTTSHHGLHRDTEVDSGQISTLLANKELLRLDLGIFILHAVLTATFIAVPMMLLHAGLIASRTWTIYVPVLVIAFLLMIPFIGYAEAKQKLRLIFIAAIVVLSCAQFFLLFFQYSIWMMSVILTLFFTAFIILEASLPSLIAKIAPSGKKGTAMGMYSTAQFLGIFAGGGLGGMVYHLASTNGVLLFSGILGLTWLLAAWHMADFQYLSTKVFDLSRFSERDPVKLREQLLQEPGVKEVSVYPDEDTVYLKVDRKLFKEKG